MAKYRRYRNRRLKIVAFQRLQFGKHQIGINLVFLVLQALETPIAHESQASGQRREASVGVILMSIYLPMFQMAGGPSG